jgi:hypothetical protein
LICCPGKVPAEGVGSAGRLPAPREPLASRFITPRQAATASDPTRVRGRSRPRSPTRKLSSPRIEQPADMRRLNGDRFLWQVGSRMKRRIVPGMAWLAERMRDCMLPNPIGCGASKPAAQTKCLHTYMAAFENVDGSRNALCMNAWPSRADRSRLGHRERRRTHANEAIRPAETRERSHCPPAAARERSHSPRGGARTKPFPPAAARERSHLTPQRRANEAIRPPAEAGNRSHCPPAAARERSHSPDRGARTKPRFPRRRANEAIPLTEARERSHGPRGGAARTKPFSPNMHGFPCRTPLPTAARWILRCRM